MHLSQVSLLSQHVISLAIYQSRLCPIGSLFNGKKSKMLVQAQNPARMRCMEELTAARAQSDEDHRCTARCVQKMEGKRRTRGAAKCYKEDSDGEWEDEIMVIVS